ncbi:DEAD/DEAH box helicase [Aurantibacillus circumpalustris]|uniref:DEAD/DEAH box helicase n=1 Tax=Aurantibacillus circumpalustris TaxID=3036359 RepID=UPI00295B4622|nr:DEAD/DEAH box helicase [Aurantibacillus circumpalustris]
MNKSKIFSNFNITELNVMQNATLEAVSNFKDVVLISPTGSGKTLAFLLPFADLLDKDKTGVQAIIIVPTRELAQQIEHVFKQMATGFKISCCYGGHSVQIERNNLLESPAVLVGTPGRIAHHIRKKSLFLTKTDYLILDEFDKSLEAGFQDEMSFIIKTIQHPKKRILTSATAISEIPSFVGIKEPKELNFTTEEKQGKGEVFYKKVRSQVDEKLNALLLLLGKINAQSTIVFCNHRDAVNRISFELSKLNVAHGFYHGGLEQIDREKTLIKLRNGSVNLLISTDLAARGLDIPEIEAVIHFQLPLTEDAMIHRNGRTARMNASGTVYFMLEGEDYLPPFLQIVPEDEILLKKINAPKPSVWKTLYISAGKKDKVNKMDIVGMLLQKGGLKKEELGKIEVLDHSSYAAIKSDKIVKTVNLIRDERIKNKKVKIEIST